MGIPSHISKFSSVASILFMGLGSAAVVIACGDDDVDLNLSTGGGSSDAGTDSGKKTPTTIADAGEDAAPIDQVEGEVKTYTVSATVTGLTGGTLVLQNNNGNDLTITADGAAVFTTPVADTTGYSVTVKTQPAGQVCAATLGSGTIAGANVTTVAVTCQKGFKVGGTITGLVGTGLVLKNNGGDTLTVGADATTFELAGLVATTGPFDVSVSASPAEQTCTVTDETGSGTIANADYVGVEIVCTAKRYEIGGAIAGLVEGAQITLSNNADLDDTITSANGNFKLPKTQVKDADYDLQRVFPSTTVDYVTQACTLASNTGKVASANVTNVTVTCSATTFCANTSENGSADLACPAGQVVTSVDFASFGTATGGCGALVKSDCDAAGSMATVSTECVGKGSCTVRGGNGIYGDPCSGTLKHLAVQVTCGNAL